ncbi:hypothetical protein ACWZJV_26245 [Nocardioides sp. WG-D5]
MATLLVRWTTAVTMSEGVGFLVPVAVGTTMVDRPWYVGLPALLGAGAVEGAVLGWAQSVVLRGVLPGVRGHRWVMLTSGAAVVAYLLGMASALTATTSGWMQMVLPILCGLLLVLSIGAAQWLELRHHVPHAASWAPATAVAWLLALGAFLAIATPLWHEGQRPWVTVLIGVGAGLVMAFVQAVLTGWWLVRLLSWSVEAARQ